MTLLTPETFFVIAGLFLGVMSFQILFDPAHPRRLGSAVFWALLASVSVFGSVLPPFASGCAVLTMVALAGCGQVAAPTRKSPNLEEREAEARRLGNWLLVPTLIIPLLVIAGGFALPRIHFGDISLAGPQQVTIVALGLAALAGIAFALGLTRARPAEALSEGGGLLQIIGWALLLPQMLAALGGIFADAGVGDVIADLVETIVPTSNPTVAVIVYCGGMALFTIIMGNAFAAFPVITLGVGMPFIVEAHGGNPAIMGAIGMLSGYCGTLVTPMAANFNLVPAHLLEIPDKHAIIRAQVPFAAAIWTFNVIVMALCVYRF